MTTFSNCYFFRYKDSDRIVDGSKYETLQEGNKYFLIIKDVTENDVGVYRVAAGPHTSSANLTVKEGGKELKELRV